MPFDFNGMVTGSTTVFFSYIRFDVILMDLRNPQRNIPIGIVASLVILETVPVSLSTVLFIGYNR
ncbi:amino acid transporter [Neobacillus niacini]|nr:amino acid transporter [Neobacillus niacini]